VITKALLRKPGPFTEKGINNELKNRQIMMPPLLTLPAPQGDWQL